MWDSREEYGRSSTKGVVEYKGRRGLTIVERAVVASGDLSRDYVGLECTGGLLSLESWTLSKR